MHFFVCYRTVLHPFGHDDKFSRADHRFAIAKFHPQLSFDDQEEFVFIVVMVPDEFALELDGFND
jgi:hypothetical protein